MTADFKQLTNLIRYYILTMSSRAGSGHPTSSLSATDLMTVLMFGGNFKYDQKQPKFANNDRLIFSKGHASPLYYALWVAAGVLTEKDLESYREFESILEGHPSTRFPHAEATTGSLGQGLSIGFGMALNAKYIDKLPYKTYVLLGDSEMAEGSVWEAMELAAHYKLDNLIAIVDVNRLGQRGPTMYEHDLKNYEAKAKAFGWETIVIDGHSFEEIDKAYSIATGSTSPASGTLPTPGEGRPVMIIAKTLKGKGISFLEDKDGWHGKALPADRLDEAIKELGDIDKSIRGQIAKPKIATSPQPSPISEREPKAGEVADVDYPKDKPVATRKAYGNALVRIFPAHPNMVVLDGEVSNSTHAEIFKDKYSDRFFEMFIAEQNMAGAALGLSRRGKMPFVSTFAAFFTRAFDQIRMSQYSDANIKFCGSHAGVSIGADGPSQMGLEDLAMFRTLLNSVVLYPSDAVSAEKLVAEMAEHEGLAYLRTTRMDTPVIYDPNEEFPIGGSKVLRQSPHDRGTVVAAGVTLHEALKAYEELKKQGIMIRVIDLYSVKPLDVKTLKKAAAETKNIITVEDHYAEGGIGEAVAAELGMPVTRLAVRKTPMSGKPEQLLDYEDISAQSIIKVIKGSLSPRT